MFVVDNMKMRQQGEDPGNELEFKFHLCKLFISILLSSTLVTGEGFEIAKSFPGKSSKMTLESLRFKSCSDGFSYCLIANFISHSWFGKQKTLHTSTPQGFKTFSKRSDSGERCKVKKAMKSRGGLGREVREGL